jgi:hypothetical protein
MLFFCSRKYCLIRLSPLSSRHGNKWAQSRDFDTFQIGDTRPRRLDQGIGLALACKWNNFILEAYRSARHCSFPLRSTLECITDKQANPGVIVNCQFMTCGTGAGPGRVREEEFSNFAPCARFDALIRVSSFWTCLFRVHFNLPPTILPPHCSYCQQIKVQNTRPPAPC